MNFRQEIIKQIGTRNMMAISGLRATATENGVLLPVGQGYKVQVELEADDTYTVSRLFVRGGKVKEMGRESMVYADQVGDSAYRASCFVNVEFGQ